MIEKQFEKWLQMKTQFDRDFFFDKIKEVMSGYDCGEPIEKGDAIEWRCKTAERDVSHVDDNGKLVSRKAKLDIKVYAIFGENCCSVGYECSGHGEDFGQSGPYKTKNDLEQEALEYSLGVMHIPKRSGPRYEQLTLF